MPKPLLIGYQTIRLNTAIEDVANGHRLLAMFAAQEGYALGTVFEERNANRPCSALVSLIEMARRGGVSAVAAPRAEDLGLLPRVQELTRKRVEREGGIRVLIVGKAA